MLKQRFNYVSMLITGLFFSVLGCSFLFEKWSPWNWLYFTFVIGVSIVGTLRILNFALNFRKLNHRFREMTDVLFWIILLMISLANDRMFYALFPRAVGIWILLHAIVKIIVISIKIKDHLSGWLHSLIFLLGDLFMSFVLLFMPHRFAWLIDAVMGCYFIVYGSNVLLDFIREVIPAKRKEEIENKQRLAIPPSMAAIIPPALIRFILSKDKDEQEREDFEAIKADIPIDLEVFVHMAPSGPAMLGHVDIAYQGYLLSYGCYDPHHRRLLGTLGDGVVLLAPKNKYIYNCLKNENKVLVGFGIALNEKQKQAFQARLCEMLSQLSVFECDEQLKQRDLSYKGACEDYLSRVTRNVENARYFKYRDGKFKTFFVLSTNCVYFITHLLSTIGLNLIDMSGIISPGSYFDFLNKQFKSDKSFVISRHVYTKHNMHLFMEANEEGEDNCN